LRIACSPEETQAGCSGGGPYWEWLPSPLENREPDEAFLQRVASEEPIEEEVAAPVAGGAADGGGA
jgi:penicillin-insensitive murein endopeptidase